MRDARRSMLLAAALAALVAAPAARAAPPASCPGQPLRADRVLTGSFAHSLQGSYVLLPFSVPRGVTQVRVKYCWDQPESPAATAGHTLDLGVYDSLRRGDRMWGAREFRGWGGSSHPDVALSRGGFSSTAAYLRDPKGYVPGRTTRGFEPGPARPGRWAVELGVAAVTPRDQGDLTGEVGWRVEIELSRNAAYAKHPYRPARYRSAPVRRRAGWYQGDLHVHDEHSNLGAATIAETLGYAFRARSRGGAGLDFTSLSDYVTDTAWGEIGRYQPRYPRRLVIPSAEVITYRGHLANQDAGGWVDYRTGPVYERRPDGTLRRLRGPIPPRTVFRAIHRLGGFTVINHPRIFPPVSYTAAAVCRGCYWGYSDVETGFGSVDAIEVMNVAQAFDPARTIPNPFTGPAIDYWQHALARGFHVAAVGGSDTHNAGRTRNATDSPLGQPATVVYAKNLSADAIKRGVQAGHTYVKAFGSGGPDLRLTARAPRSRHAAIMGDRVSGGRVRIEGRVLNATGAVPRVLELQRDGKTIRTVPVTGQTASVTLTTGERGRYGLVLMRGAVVEAICTPIWLTAAGRAR